MSDKGDRSRAVDFQKPCGKRSCSYCGRLWTKAQVEWLDERIGDEAYVVDLTYADWQAAQRRFCTRRKNGEKIDFASVRYSDNRVFAVCTVRVVAEDEKPVPRDEVLELWRDYLRKTPSGVPRPVASGGNWKLADPKEPRAHKFDSVHNRTAPDWAFEDALKRRGIDAGDVNYLKEDAELREFGTAAMRDEADIADRFLGQLNFESELIADGNESRYQFERGWHDAELEHMRDGEEHAAELYRGGVRCYWRPIEGDEAETHEQNILTQNTLPYLDEQPNPPLNQSEHDDGLPPAQHLNIQNVANP
jgi:hypothetical protein